MLFMLDEKIIQTARFVLSVTAYDWLHPQTRFSPKALSAKAMQKQLALFQRVLRAIVRLGTQASPFAKRAQQAARRRRALNFVNPSPRSQKALCRPG